MGGTVEKGPAKRGRPKTEIDYALVRRYAQAQCTQEAIATMLHLSLSTCTHDADFLLAYAEGKEEGKRAVLVAQYNLALKGNADMLKWFGKQHMGQADKVENKNDDRVTIVIAGDDANV